LDGALAALVEGSTYSISFFMSPAFYVLCAHKISMIGAIFCARET